MASFRRSSRAKVNTQSGDMPAANAVYFYLIILVSVALPVAIAASVMFVPVVVDTIILVLLLALLAGMAYAYRKFVGQTRKLMDELKLLEDDQEATISILGGFLSVTLEQSTETTTVPKIMADDRHKDSGAKPAGLLMDRRPN